MAIAPFTLTGTYQNLDGSPASGKVRVDVVSPANGRVIDPDGNVVFAGPRTLVLDTAGHFSLTLPSDVTTGESATIGYRVTAQLKHNNLEPVEFWAKASGSTWDVADIATQVVVPITPTAVTTTDLDTRTATNINTAGTETRVAADAAYATPREVRSKVKTDGTDQTATLNSELSALVSAGGGTLVLPGGTITVNGAITVPNDGAVPVPHHGPIMLRGQGIKWDARSVGAQLPPGGTVLDLKGIDTYGKIKDNAVGLLGFSGIAFTDSAGTSTAFVYTTNATLHIDQCAFVGTKTGSACDQDAIVCGGTQQIEGGAGWDEGFQGYGTVISRNYFQGIRRAVYGRAFFNANTIRENTVWQRCGSNLAGGAPFEIDGRPANAADPQHACGNLLIGNLVEMAGGYPYAFKLRYAKNTNLLGNGVFDKTASSVAAYRYEDGAQFNVVVEGYRDGTMAAISQSANVKSWNSLITGQQNQPAFFSEGITSGRILGLAPDQGSGTATHTFQAFGLQVLHNYNGTAANRFYDNGAAFGGGDRYGPALTAYPSAAGRVGLSTKRPTAASGADLFEAIDENNAKLSRIDKAGRIVTKVSTAPVLADLTDGEVALYTDGSGNLKMAVRVAGVLTIKTITAT